MLTAGFDGNVGLDVDSGFEQEGGAGVPEVVEADPADSGLVAQALEFSMDAGGFEGFVGGSGEDQVGLGPVGVGDLAVVGLLGAAGEQGSGDGFGHGQGALGGVAFGFADGDALAGDAHEGLGDGQGVGVQVDVAPA